MEPTAFLQSSFSLSIYWIKRITSRILVFQVYVSRLYSSQIVESLITTTIVPLNFVFRNFISKTIQKLFQTRLLSHKKQVSRSCTSSLTFVQILDAVA